MLIFLCVSILFFLFELYKISLSICSFLTLSRLNHIHDRGHLIFEAPSKGHHLLCDCTQRDDADSNEEFSTEAYRACAQVHLRIPKSVRRTSSASSARRRVNARDFDLCRVRKIWLHVSRMRCCSVTMLRCTFGSHVFEKHL